MMNFNCLARVVSLTTILSLLTEPLVVSAAALQKCGDAYYSEDRYTCYDSSFLCPVLGGQPTLRCGNDCYSPRQYSCQGGHLALSSSNSCPNQPTTLQLDSPPYKNYFYSDCHTSAQVVVTSPVSGSNLSYIGPRLLVAWPGGNSGLVAYFAPQNGVNGSLTIGLSNSSIGSPLGAVYETPSTRSGNATVGIQARLELSSPANLSIAVLGSIRTIRDFTEGPSLLYPVIQDALKYSTTPDGGVSLSRLWLDNITTTTLSFVPATGGQPVTLSNTTVRFAAGNYTFSASYNYPQLVQISPPALLNLPSQGLIQQQPTQTTSLSFLSYTSKLTAGAWRFLTYFGRDTMIAALLLEPVLSTGKGGAIEAVLSEVLERINRADGSVCHEETIGDYATWLNLRNNITSTEPLCDYKMIDTDFFLPVLLEQYLVRNSNGSSRAQDFLGTPATIFPANANLTYADLALISAEKIMNISAAFAASGGQTINNLIHLKGGEVVGQWRDSTYGIGGGKVPYDVNTALVPAALRAIASLATAGVFPSRPNWPVTAATSAQIWEDSTLTFFEVSLSQSEAQSRLSSYINESGFKGDSQSTTLGDEDVVFYALALNGTSNLAKVEVMNTDDSFRHFLLNTTNQAQLTRFVNSTANSVRRRFPAGLMTDVSMLVANPAFGGEAVYAENFTTSAYHGTVVWSWPLAMMARGLELQLSRCADGSSQKPEFCGIQNVHSNVVKAYNVLWDSIDSNRDHLTTEVWSWTYDKGGEKFQFIELGELPPPAGQNPTESNIVQLWSLTFLGVTRDRKYL